jgi:mRNA interferase RelE/StbE
MEIIITKTFEKQLKLVPKYIKESTIAVLEALETAKNVTEIKDLKKLSGYTNYYRIRIGNYRMGLQIINPKIIVVTILHRGTIYKVFP